MFPRGPEVRSFSHRCLLVAILALVLGGCGDDDDNPIKPPDDPGVLTRDTPQNALALYVSVYEARDSTAIMECFDSTYTGGSTDINGPGGTIDLTFRDEANHAAAIAKTTDLLIDLDLGPSSSWIRLPSDDPNHPEWSVITISGSSFHLQLTDGVELVQAGGDVGTFQEFAFTPSLDSSSATDTLWHIVRWREVGSSAPGP
jgi:hypothetical protein